MIEKLREFSHWIHRNERIGVTHRISLANYFLPVEVSKLFVRCNLYNNSLNTCFWLPWDSKGVMLSRADSVEEVTVKRNLIRPNGRFRVMHHKTFSLLLKAFVFLFPENTGRSRLKNSHSDCSLWWHWRSLIRSEKNVAHVAYPLCIDQSSLSVDYGLMR